MKKLVLVLALLAPTVAIADDTDTNLAALAKAAKCTDATSPWRPWCIATEWSKGKPEMPKGTLLGLTIELGDKLTDATAKSALSNKVSLSALSVTGDKVKLTSITPSDPGEEKMIAEAAFNLSAVFKGKSKTAAVNKDLAGFIKGKKGEYASTKGATGVTWKGANTSELRRVGNFWVLIEHPLKGGGIWATILTDAWQ